MQPDMSWGEAPSILDVNHAIKKLASLEGELEAIDREIEETEDELASEFPRKPTERRKRMKELLDRRSVLKVKKIEANADVRFNAIRVEMFEILNRKASKA